MEWNKDDIEYIITHLKQPERLTEEVFMQWLEDQQHLELFRMILNQREAFLRREDYGNINGEMEFENFMKRVSISESVFSRKSKHPARGNSLRYRYWWGVAASLLLLLSTIFFIFRGALPSLETDLTAVYTGKRCAELLLADGQLVRLQQNIVELQEQNGIRITNDSNSLLTYRQDLSIDINETKLVYNTLRIPAGADYVVNLSDGTRVHLNCESEFRFPITFTGDERRVYLDGEAFFEVDKCAEWPFVVVTDKMNVRATGTSFNVKSYQKDQIIATTLVTGGVEIESEQSSDTPIPLAPSQQFTLNKITGESEVLDVDERLYTDWTEGVFVFRNQRLEEVMQMLARWYTLEIIYLHESVKELRLSAHLGRYEHIDSLIQIIQAMDKINIKRKDNTVILDWK